MPARTVFEDPQRHLGISDNANGRSHAKSCGHQLQRERPLMHIDDSLIRKWVSVANDTLAAPPMLLAATIAADESLSQPVAVPKGKRLWALALPAGWSESEISYQISFIGREYYEA